MGFGFRKSKKIAPGIKLNMSKNGLGLSFGVKGCRVSVNSKGTYLNAGANGVCYRKKLNSKPKQKDLQPGFENGDNAYKPYMSYFHMLEKVNGNFEYAVFENSDYILEEFVAFNKLKDGLFKYIGIILFIIGCFVHWVWLLNVALFVWLKNESKKFILKPQKEVFENLKNLLNEVSDNYILHNVITNEELQYGVLEVKICLIAKCHL